MDFKFISHGLLGEKQNNNFQHNYEKEFWTLTNNCANKLEHENEAPGIQRGSLVFMLKLICTFIGQNPNSFFMIVLKNDIDILLLSP
jgi:hypothetical protein